MGTPISLFPTIAGDKATRCRVRHADAYQRGRQGAMRGMGQKVARQANIAFATLQHELDDAERDVVRKVAMRVRAMKACGAAPERITLYLLEILDAMQDAMAGADLTTLVRMEAATDADEDMAEVRALMGGMTPENRRIWREQLVRNMANERALLEVLA